MRRAALALLVLLSLDACSAPRAAAPSVAPTPVVTPEPSPRGSEPVVRTSPIVSGNVPTPIAGRSNGRLLASDLVTVEGSCREARAAAPSLARMLAAARADGVGIATNDCYRPIDRQAAARARSCAGGNCACAGKPGGSMHGWGKAVDIEDTAGSITSPNSRAMHWLVANAARFGWNHPGWARPGGSLCPETWHWEWVGDGGTMHADPVRVDVIGMVASAEGYEIVSATGAGTARGDAPRVAAPTLASLVVAVAPSSSGDLMLTAAGDVLTESGARAFAPVSVARPVAIATTNGGTGAYVAASDGRVVHLGNAAPVADGPVSAHPVVGAAATPSGSGCLLLASDGTVLARGDAHVLSPPGAVPHAIGLAATPTGGGYWIAASDGTVHAFGDAKLHATLPSPVRRPVVAIAGTQRGDGYWLVTADGGVFAFGAAGYYGSG